MRSLSWCTDLHLERADQKSAEAFFNALTRLKEPLLIAGDISDAKFLVEHLEKIEKALTVPFYFVLGNHDYWGSSLEAVRKRMEKRSYLPNQHPIILSESTALIGHDGWADGRAGDFMGTDVVLNDFNFIANFRGLSKKEQLRAVNQLGDEAALFLEKKLTELFKTFRHALVLTHVPPFIQTALYQQKHAEPSWSCYMVSVAVGEKIAKVMEAHPSNLCTVLCGHTHHAADVSIMPNLRVIVGEAKYGSPRLQHPLEII